MGQDNYRWPKGRICSGHPVRTEALDDLVWGSVKDLLLTPSTVINEYQHRLKRCKTDYEAIISEKANEIARYKRERDRLIDLYQSGIVEKEEIEDKLKSIRSKVDQLSDEMTYLLNQEKESKKLLTVIRSLDDFTGNLGKNLDSHTFDEKRNIVKFLIEEVEVDTVNEEINVKHIIPLHHEKCQLRSRTQNASLGHAFLCVIEDAFVNVACCEPLFKCLFVYRDVIE